MKTIFTTALVAAIFLAIGLVVGQSSAPAQSTLAGQTPQVTDGNCYLLNGQHRCPTKVVMRQGTTTVCAIKSPAATSTLSNDGQATMSISSTTASTWTWAKSSTPYATTTLLDSQSISANSPATVPVASSTASTLVNTNRIFAPNTYLVGSMTGGSGTFSPVGYCGGEFIY